MPLPPAPIGPIRYEDKTIAIILSEEDRARCYEYSGLRFIVNRTANNRDGAYREGRGALNDFEGLLAEVAMWRVCGRDPFQEKLILPYKEWKAKRATGLLLDVIGLEIRATALPTGKLVIHKDEPKDAAKVAANIPFVLAIVARSKWDPESVIRTGVAEVDALLESRDLPHYDREVLFMGHFLGRDVERRHYFTETPKPDYFVPQDELRPMQDLADGRFLDEAQYLADFLP
jgi:hypothetical protein